MKIDGIKELLKDLKFSNKGGNAPERVSKLINELEQVLMLCSVSQRRIELLAYHRFLQEELNLDLNEIWVEEYLKANNFIQSEQLPKKQTHLNGHEPNCKCEPCQLLGKIFCNCG